MTGQSVKFKKHIKTIKKRSPVRVSQLRNKIFFEKCQRPTEKVQSLSISNVNRNVFNYPTTLKMNKYSQKKKGKKKKLHVLFSVHQRKKRTVLL